MEVGPLDDYGDEVKFLVGKTQAHAKECYQAAGEFYQLYEARLQRAISKTIGIGYAQFSFKLSESTRAFGIGTDFARDIASGRPRLPVNETSQYSLTIVDCLSIGTGKWSQVYKCQVQGDGIDVDAFVVLKLYQESLFAKPNVEHFCPWLEFEFAQQTQPAGFFVKREAFAYNALAAEQGKLVPWCYGFYKYQLSSGEEVEAVILEYITGETVPEYLKAHLRSIPATETDIPLVRATLQTVLDAYVKILERGVAHGDGGNGNIIVKRGSSPTDFSVILLDFGLAMGEAFCGPDLVLRQYAIQAYTCLRISYEHLVPNNISDDLMMIEIIPKTMAIFAR